MPRLAGVRAYFQECRAFTGASALDVWFAWAYVVLRVIHSFWQSLVNTIPVRLTLFVLSSAMLIVLSVRALMLTL